MLSDSKKILETNAFLNGRKNNKIIARFNRFKRMYFILSVFLCLILISAIYLFSNKSNIYRISIDGNVYLSDEDIVSLSKLSLDDKFIFVSKDNTQRKIKTNELIDTCVVEKLDDRLVKISVKEKKIIGYAFENNENNLILQDDTRISLNKDNLYLINSVPLIEGFSKDELILIEKNFDDIDYKMINEISEIHKFPLLKFQDHEIIMRDGNYIFTSVYGLNLINKYYDMVSSYTKDGNECYYIEDISGNAYTSACPWQTSPTEVKPVEN